MPVYPKAGVSIVADSSDFDAAYKQVLKEAGNLDSLAPTVKVGVSDADLRAAVGLANDLDKSHEAKVTVNQSDLDEALGILNDIKNLSVIDIALNLTGASLNVLETLKGLPGIGQLLSNDNATAILSAGAGGTSPEELAIAQDLFANNMVESVEAGALLINQLKTLGVTGTAGLTEAANSALNAQQAFLAVGQEADASQIILAQNQLVITGLAKDYSEASDIIAAGLDQGLNTGDDFLDTITEYSNNFANAGASAQEFLSILNTGLESGFGNTDRVADLFRETTLRGLNPDETAAQDALRAAGLADETAAMQAGELAATTWFQTVIDTIKAESNAGTQQTLAADIFGTQAEDQTVLGALGINTVDAAFDTIEGRAAEVATLLNTTVSNAFTELFNTINLEAAELLSDDTLNLDQKLQDIKTAIQTTIDEIQSGTGVGRAIEIGFDVEGIDEGLANIQRVFGQFYLSLLEIVATIQDPTGLGTADNATRAEIARQATQQLAFDIKVANPDELDGIINQALNRGVVDLGGSLRTAMDELVAEGNFEQVRGILAEIIADPSTTPEAAAALVSEFNTKIGEAIAEQSPPTLPPAWTQNFSGLNPLMPKAGSGGGKAFAGLGSTGAKGTNWWDNLPPPPEVNTAIEETSTAIEESGGVATTWADNITAAVETVATSATTNMDTATEALNTLDLAGIQLDTNLANYLTGNTVTASFDAMSASAVANADVTKGAFTGILATVSEVDARMSAFFDSVMAKVGAANSAIANIGVVPAGGGGTTNNTNIVVTNNNNVEGGAQAKALGYELGAQIRGMA